jgi:hypothetical protein
MGMGININGYWIHRMPATFGSDEYYAVTRPDGEEISRHPDYSAAVRAARDLPIGPTV